MQIQFTTFFVVFLPSRREEIRKKIHLLMKLLSLETTKSAVAFFELIRELALKKKRAVFEEMSTYSSKF